MPYLHTLAVARMGVDQFDRAIETATQAVALARQKGDQQYIRILDALIDSWKRHSESSPTER